MMCSTSGVGPRAGLSRGRKCSASVRSSWAMAETVRRVVGACVELFPGKWKVACKYGDKKKEGEIQAEADASADLAAAAATPVPAVPDAELLSGVPDAALLDDPPETPNLPTVPAAPPAASDEVWRV